MKAAAKGQQVTRDQTAIDLPDYIVRRNEQALAAGLQIQKQALRPTDGSLTTWYVGSEQAWRTSKFVPEGFVFPPKISLKACVWAPTHWMRCHFPITRQLDGSFRGSITSEPIPEHTQALGDGIMAYEFRVRSQHYIAYHGPARVMIARGIAPSGVEDGSSGPRGAGVSMWRSFIEGDSLLLIKDLIAIEEDRKAKEVSQAPEHNIWIAASAETAGSLPNTCGRLARRMIASLLDGLIVGKSGEKLAFDADSRSTIADALDELCEEIESARVLVRSSAAKAAVRPLPHDPSFKRFLSAAMGDR